MNQSKQYFEALGETVPKHRIEKAREQAADMGCKSVLFVDDVANAIQKDEPDRAINISRNHLDLTGTYRLLAYLCVGEGDA